MNEPVQTGFDWKVLDTETRASVQAATERLHTLERRTGESIIEIGRTLLEVKEDIGHGQFGGWLDAEFGWSWQTANNFMNVAEAFRDKFQTVGNFQARALYALASGSVPAEVREEFVAKAEAGERVTHKDVKQRLAVVDLESGEIVEPATADPEPATQLVVPPRHQAHSLTLPANDTARKFSESLADAVAPNICGRALAGCEFKLRDAIRHLNETTDDALVEYAGGPERERLETIIELTSRLLERANAVTAQMRDTRLRAVK